MSFEAKMKKQQRKQQNNVKKRAQPLDFYIIERLIQLRPVLKNGNIENLDKAIKDHGNKMDGLDNLKFIK